MARSWLGRNGLSLAVIVLSIAGIVWITLVSVLLDRAEAAPRIVEVPSGESIEIGGYTWKLDESNSVDGEDLDTELVPEGGEMIGALLVVKPIEGATLTEESCATELTAPSAPPPSAEQRRVWATILTPSEFGYGLLPDSTSTCTPEGEAYQLESVFFTPAGVYDEATLDLTFLPGDNTVYRFALVPKD